MTQIDEVRKNVHQTHLESLVFTGPEGIREINGYIIDNLDQETSMTNKTTKVDGAPALFCGCNVPNYPDHFVGIKSVLNGPENAYSTAEEIEAKKPNIAKEMIYGLDLAKYIPDGEIWQGDVLFTKGEVKEQQINGNDYLVFQPNTVVYAFPDTNPDYEKLKNADFGICFHTIYRGEEGSFSQSFKVDLQRINVPDNYFLMSPALKVNRDKADTKELKKVYSELRDVELKLLNDSYYEDLCNNEVFRKYWDTFENHITSDQKATHINKNTFIGDLTKWVEDKMTDEFNTKMSKLKTDKGKEGATQKHQVALSELQYLIEQRKETLSNMVDCFNLVVDVKDILISWLSDNPGYDTYLQSRTKGYIPSSGEGIALSDDEGNIVKLVNRAEFSNANRDPDIIKGFEHESLEEANENNKIVVRAYINNLTEDVLTGNPDDYTEEMINEWFDFVEDVEDYIEDNFDMISSKASNVINSLSNYIDFYKYDDQGNREKYIVDLRVSDHKQSGDARQNRINKVKKLDQNYKLITVTVNNKTYDSYEDAFNKIKELIGPVKVAKTENYKVIDKLNLGEEADWVKNTINTVSNTKKDPAVKATLAYHKRNPKVLHKGEMIVSSLGEDYEVNSPEAKKLNSIIYRCIKSLNDLKDQIEPTWGEYNISSRSLFHNGKHDVGVKGDKEFALKVQKFIRKELERESIETHITLEPCNDNVYDYNITVFFPTEKDKGRLLAMRDLEDELDESSFGSLDD